MVGQFGIPSNRIYHHLPVLKGVNKPFYESTNQWEKDIYVANMVASWHHFFKPIAHAYSTTPVLDAWDHSIILTIYQTIDMKQC